MDKINAVGVGIALGVAFGAVIGALTDNVGLWLPVGIAVGAGMGTPPARNLRAGKRKFIITLFRALKSNGR